MWGLADCNNFFVSCERTVNPSLEGKPVVVLSNNDGCVVARSNESKRLGVKMGQPAFELRELIDPGKLIALSGNHLLYRKISLEVHDVFRRYVPRSLDYSVDEAFLDLNGVDSKWFQSIGEGIVNSCISEVGIPVTVGIAQTKTLAKIATETGKKHNERVVILTDPQIIKDALKNIPIHDIWGIGRRLSLRLYTKGVHTAFDFINRPSAWIRKEMGINGEKTWRELNGEPCIELSHINREIQDSISETRTFPQDESDYDYLRARISIYAADCARKLRDMKGHCMSVSTFLCTNRFHQDRERYTPIHQIDFPHPVNDTQTIVKAALQSLSIIYSPQFAYKRGGVMLSKITGADCYTPSLFDTPEDNTDNKKRSPNRLRLNHTIDSINSITGMPVVKLASQLVAGQPGHNDGYSSSFQAPVKNRKGQ